MTANRAPFGALCLYSAECGAERNAAAGRCLDAAHGACRRTCAIVQRVHATCGETHDADILAAGDVRRRRRIVAFCADTRQDSRRIEAVARSRRSMAIAGMDAPRGRRGASAHAGMKNWRFRTGTGQRIAESACRAGTNLWPVPLRAAALFRMKRLDNGFRGDAKGGKPGEVRCRAGCVPGGGRRR